MAEELELQAASRLRVGRVVDLLEDARHGEDVGRFEALDVGDEVLRVRGEACDVSRVHRHDADEPGEDVGHRQGEEAALVPADDVREAVVERAVDRHVEQIAMGQASAFGEPRRPRRVDDGRQVVGGRGVDAPVDLLIALGLPECGDLVDRVFLDHVNRLEMLDVVEDGGEHVMELPGFGDGDAAVRVVDDPTGLLCRIGLVDGDELCSDCPDGLVEEGELIARMAHDGDVIVRLDAHGDQAAGQLADLRVELAPCHRHPRVDRGLAFEYDLLGAVDGVISHHPGDAHRIRDLDLAGTVGGPASVFLDDVAHEVLSDLNDLELR